MVYFRAVINYTESYRTERYNLHGLGMEILSRTKDAGGIEGMFSLEVAVDGYCWLPPAKERIKVPGAGIYAIDFFMYAPCFGEGAVVGWENHKRIIGRYGDIYEAGWKFFTGETKAPGDVYEINMDYVTAVHLYRVSDGDDDGGEYRGKKLRWVE